MIKLVEQILLSVSSIQMSFNKLSTKSLKWTSVQNMRSILQAINPYPANVENKVSS